MADLVFKIQTIYFHSRSYSPTNGYGPNKGWFDYEAKDYPKGTTFTSRQEAQDRAERLSEQIPSRPFRVIAKVRNQTVAVYNNGIQIHETKGSVLRE